MLHLSNATHAAIHAPSNKFLFLYVCYHTWSKESFFKCVRWRMQLMSYNVPMHIFAIQIGAISYLMHTWEIGEFGKQYAKVKMPWKYKVSKQFYINLLGVSVNTTKPNLLEWYFIETEWTVPTDINIMFGSKALLYVAILHYTSMTTSVGLHATYG